MRPNPQETADLVTFTEEILDRKLHLLCSVCCQYIYKDTLSLRRTFLRKHAILLKYDDFDFLVNFLKY